MCILHSALATCQKKQLHISSLRSCCNACTCQFSLLLLHGSTLSSLATCQYSRCSCCVQTVCSKQARATKTHMYLHVNIYIYIYILCIDIIYMYMNIYIIYVHTYIMYIYIYIHNIRIYIYIIYELLFCSQKRHTKRRSKARNKVER